MGIVFKDQDGNILDSNGNPEVKIITTTEGIDVGVPAEIKMSEEMTTRLWEVINENTELKQQLYMVENKLEQIKRLL